MVREQGKMMGNHKRKKAPHRPKWPPKMVSLYRLLRLMHKDAERVASEPQVIGRKARGGGYDGTGRKLRPESHGLEEQPPHVVQLLLGGR